MRLILTRPPTTGTRPAIFLDRDGVINRRIAGGYVTNWRQFTFVRGIKTALARLSRMGIPLIVVSNQAGVGKGFVTRHALRDITERFVAALAKAGARIDAVYYCPHTPEDRCSCRKPRPGLLRQAARDWRLSLKRSVLIGDSLSDLEAACAVHCPAIFLTVSPNALAEAGLASLGEVTIARKPSEIPRIVSRWLSQKSAKKHRS
jgi:histidinol-phosphate phosphatase family protein